MSGRRDRDRAVAVLDASALIAWVKEEAGGQRVEPLLARSLVSAVNLSEVLAEGATDLPPAEEARWWRSVAGVRVVQFDEHDAIRAAELRAATRSAGLSLGDRACLALAARHKLPVWTADAAWAALGLKIDVRLVRERLR